MVINEEKVKGDDIDPYGVVHHSTYLRFYENAISRAIEEEMQGKVSDFFCKRMDVKFIASAHRKDRLSVLTECVSKKGNDLTFKQKIQRKNKVINSAITVVRIIK